MDLFFFGHSHAASESCASTATVYFAGTVGLAIGLTVCVSTFPPTPTAWSVTVNASDLTARVRIAIAFNQSISANVAVLTIATASCADQRLMWGNNVSSVNALPELNSLLTLKQIGCNFLSDVEASTLPFVSACQSTTCKANGWTSAFMFANCSSAQMRLPSATAVIYNTSTLILDLPAPVYRLNNTYTVVLPQNAMCTTPTLCSPPFSFSFTTPADPFASLRPTGISFDVATPSGAFALAANTHWNVSSWMVPNTARRVIIRYDGVLPLLVSFLALLIPVDAGTLRDMLPSVAAQSVGASTCLGVAATKFTDRYVLHPDARSGTGFALPVSVLTACAPVATDPTSLQCTLPANATGSLFRLHVDWMVPFGPCMPDPSPCVVGSQQFGVHRFIPGLPVRTSQGDPLILSFPVSVLTRATLRRFPIDTQGTRQPLPNADSWVFSGSEASQPSPFDETSMMLSPSASALSPVSQPSELLFTMGQFIPSPILPCAGCPPPLPNFAMFIMFSPLRMFLGIESNSLPCVSVRVSSSWLLCSTTPLPQGGRAVNLPLSLWDSRALTVTFSPDTYSYPYIPAVFNLTGCQPAGPDSTSKLIDQCPCVGAVWLTVVGANLFPPLLVTVGYTAVPLSDVVILDTDNYTSFRFRLPMGASMGWL